MSFFKDFKADFSQAMNELMPDSNEMYDEDEVVEEERNKKKDKAVAKAEKQAKRAAKSKKTEDKEDREDRKVKAVRPPKEVPLKTKVVEEPEDEDLGIAPEDMSDQVDELLDNELYSDENDPSMLLQDDMEVNTMDMSVAEMLNQLSEKQEPVGEQLSVDDLLSQLGQSSSVPEEMEEAPEPVPETISDQDEQVDTSVGGKDLGLEELLASIGAKQATPATETIAEEVEEELVEEETEEEVIEEPEEEFVEEVIEEAEEEELEEEVIEELEEEELEEEVMEEPEEEELEEEVIEEPEEEFVEEVEELEDVPVQASIPEEKPVAPTRSVSAQDEDALLTQKLEELARSMNKQATNVKEEPLSEPVAEVIEEVVEPVKETTDTIEKAAEPVKAAAEIIENASETTEETINPVEEVAELVKTKKDNKKEIKENVEDNKMSEEKDVISINAVEEEKAAEVKAEEVKAEEVEETAFNVEDADDETTYVTKATKISGDLETEGSIDIIGNINGNVSCKGKIVIGGQVKGNILAGELYANNARVEGDIKSYGSVKVGVGSMILGGIKAESAVIAGAVNGDIDVNGPVIVDSTAVIMGNINSRSVQINNGAVIEGFCSQSYSEIDVKNYFS